MSLEGDREHGDAEHDHHQSLLDTRQNDNHLVAILKDHLINIERGILVEIVALYYLE